MTYLLRSDQSKTLDRLSEQLGMGDEILMANAGRAVADLLCEKTKPAEGPVVFFIGKGNNGQDAAIAARHLEVRGYETVRIADPAALEANVGEIGKASWLVDGLLGVGLQGEVRGWYPEAIARINASGRPVLAVDVPSGLSADSGKILGTAVKAAVTLCLGGLKLGCLLYPGCEFSGEILNADIGIPREAYDKARLNFFLSEPEDFFPFIPKKPKDAHKKDFGHVLVVAGSAPMPGAGFLAALGALRAGCGVVTYALPKGALQKFENPEVMLAPLSDGGEGIFMEEAAHAVLDLCAGKQAVVLGPGLGQSPKTERFLGKILDKMEAPLILDADGLNLAAKNPALAGKRKCATVLTPHPGEMGRLLGISASAVEANRVEKALEGASRWGAVCVLKGYRSLIAFPGGTLYVNPTGNPAMASAGMGDVLAGVIGGLIARGTPPDKAALAGVYLHGLAGDLAAGDLGSRGLIASDVLGYIPKALQRVSG